MADDTAPDAPHRHRGTRAVQRMVEHAPSSGGLALWVHHVDRAADPAAATDAGGLPTADTPPATTDGCSIHYAPWFESLPLPLQTGWVAHEVLHIALRHSQRYVALQRRIGDVDLRLYNICADAIVNSTLAHLAWLALPERAVRLERLLADVLDVRQAEDAALLEWDVERLYLAVDDRSQGSRGKRDQRPSSQTGGGGRADGTRAARARTLGAQTPSDLVPGEHTLGAPELEAERTREWHERLLRGHAGDGAHSMLRALIADLPRTPTPWEQVLRTRLARALVQKPSLSWSRPSRSYIANQGRAGPGRRMPWEPGTTASRAVPRLAVVVDVSGSIDDGLMERFAREIEALSRRHGAGLVMIVGDDRVRRVEHFRPGESALREIDFEGGGNTDFTPLLEEARMHRPDIVVVLTDLDGPAHCRPACPVIWAVPHATPSQPSPVAPFGRVLPLNA